MDEEWRMMATSPKSSENAIEKSGTKWRYKAIEFTGLAKYLVNSSLHSYSVMPLSWSEVTDSILFTQSHWGSQHLPPTSFNVKTRFLSSCITDFLMVISLPPGCLASEDSGGYMLVRWRLVEASPYIPTT